MNIYKFELKTYIKSILVWALSMSALLILFMSFYQGFAKDASLMDQILENYPEEMLKAFGMDSSLSLSSVYGYFAFTFAFIQLCAAMQASNYGFTFLSVEERELTADFLISKPVKRSGIITGKFMAGFTALTITNLFIWGSSFIGIYVFGKGDIPGISNILLLLFSTTVFQLYFVCVGMVISVSVRKVRSVLSYSMALSFGLYILNALKSVIGGDILGYLSPFYHFDPVYILENGKYNTQMVLLSAVIILLAGTASRILYIKRNILSL